MTVTDVAFGSAWPSEGARPPRWSVAAATAALAIFASLQAVYVYAGEDTYRDLARGRGEVTFTAGEITWHVSESVLPELHRQTLAYVLGSSPEAARLTDGRPLFDANERAHLADVRAVFAAVRVGWAVAGILAVAMLLGGTRRGYGMRLLRDASLWGAAAVLVVGIVTAVAFEPAFLAFHYVFFPQGNFLFDPATSNLLRLYPEAYWYGVTIRIGIAVVVVLALIAALATIALRARAAR